MSIFRIMTVAGIFILGACGSGGGGGATSPSEAAASSGPVADSKSVASVDKMAVGDIYVPTLSAGATEINFSGSSSSASYILMVQSTATSPATHSAQVKSASDDEDVEAEPTALGTVVPDVESEMHTKFREVEGELSRQLAIPAEAENQPKGFSVGKAVGDSCPANDTFVIDSTKTFKVLNSLSSTTSTQNVSAVLKYVTSDLLLYIDSRGLESDFAGTLSTAEIQEMADSFQYSYEIVKGLAGNPSDIDSNCKVIVLLTLAVNELGASGGGIITGFFYASDLYPSHTASNSAEIVHLIYPDPDKKYSSSKLSKDFVKKNLLTAVFPHEVQHLINYNQKVFVGGGSTESAWVNEMLSHWIENRTGYAQENYSRYDLFLSVPNTTSLIPSGSPDIISRGASYLFLKFLSEQTSNPDTFVTCLIQSKKTGVSNIESCFNGPNEFNEFSEFMLRWGAALALTDRGVTTDSELTYKSRSYNSSTGHWQGVCLDCNAQDGRGTVLNGVATETFSAGKTIAISNAAQKYYVISSGSVPATIAISLNANANPQVVLMRVK